jgi:DNA-directed RNA polymerase subunit RPC12/RpoP
MALFKSMRKKGERVLRCPYCKSDELYAGDVIQCKKCSRVLAFRVVVEV